MAIPKDEWKDHSESDQAKLEAGDESVVDYDQIPEYAKQLFDKLNVSIDKTNEHITDVSNMKSDIALNTAKTGITSAQASAIVDNTAKTGITTTQAQQLSNLDAGRASNVGTSINKVTAQITKAINVNSKTGAATLDTMVVLSNGTRYTMSETLTKVNKK